MTMTLPVSAGFLDGCHTGTQGPSTTPAVTLAPEPPAEPEVNWLTTLVKRSTKALVSLVKHCTNHATDKVGAALTILHRRLAEVDERWQTLVEGLDLAMCQSFLGANEASSEVWWMVHRKSVDLKTAAGDVRAIC